MHQFVARVWNAYLFLNFFNMVLVNFEDLWRLKQEIDLNLQNNGADLMNLLVLSMASVIILLLQDCHPFGCLLYMPIAYIELLGSSSVTGSSGSFSSGCSYTMKGSLAGFPTHLHQTNINILVYFRLY